MISLVTCLVYPSLKCIPPKIRQGAKEFWCTRSAKPRTRFRNTRLCKWTLFDFTQLIPRPHTTGTDPSSCSAPLRAFCFSGSAPSIPEMDGRWEAEDTEISWWVVLTELLDILQVPDHATLILWMISGCFVSWIFPFEKGIGSSWFPPFEMEINQNDVFQLWFGGRFLVYGNT